MQLLDDLRAEHDLIDQVVGSLRHYVDLRVQGQGDPDDAARFMRFFRRFAGDFHHAREEDTLLVALQQHAELPADRGPIKAIADDHREMAAMLAEIETLLGQAGVEARARLAEAAREWSHALWHHIDAENSVLLPESEERLRRHGIRELPARGMTDEERSARAEGEDLVGRYPPVDDPGIIRGDGCVFCRLFGDRCEGVEHAWWNEWEWDEFDGHMSAD